MKPHISLGNSSASASESGQKVAIVGSGIVGLAHAWAAAKRGWQVTVFERDARPLGASIRNFGMVWPIGQINGPDHRTALASRKLWLEFLEDSKVWHRACGSLHVAYRQDELEVIEEFARLSPEVGFECRMLTPGEATSHSAGLQLDGLLGALWSPTEVSVDPRQVLLEMPRWLNERYGVEFRYGVPIQRVTKQSVVVADGKRYLADRVIVAAGSDFRILYPELYRNAGFKLCKLQMLRTTPQPKGWKLGPMIASGLTLRHYKSFGICSTLAKLKDRIASETPELDDLGIHVMAAQNELGELVLGDSHEYGDEVVPYDKVLIEELILRELRQILDVPNWTIGERWHGVYAKVPNCIEYVHSPEEEVYVVIPSGGCGMTMSFGLADSHWDAWSVGTMAQPVGLSVRESSLSQS